MIWIEISSLFDWDYLGKGTVFGEVVLQQSPLILPTTSQREMIATR